MAGTYSNLLYHIIFSTRERAPLITDRIREPLYRYVGGILREKGGILLEIGGVEDHVHLLARLKPSLPVSKAVRLVKSSSSKWLNEERLCEGFYWQLGYGAFTVSRSMAEDVRRYIRRQPQHHRRRSFKDELVEHLAANEVDYDQRFLLD